VDSQIHRQHGDRISLIQVSRLTIETDVFSTHTKIKKGAVKYFRTEGPT
jgi:hypothetical protein